MDKAAFSFTGDLGCESGGGVSCTGKGGNPKQAFLGYMFYNRLWFKKDLYATTIGGGQMNNPGRYLVLCRPSTEQRRSLVRLTSRRIRAALPWLRLRRYLRLHA